MCENGGTDWAKYFAWIAQHRIGAGFEPTQSSPWVKVFHPFPTASHLSRANLSQPCGVYTTHPHPYIAVELKTRSFFCLLKHKWDSATVIVLSPAEAPQRHLPVRIWTPSCISFLSIVSHVLWHQNTFIRSPLMAFKSLSVF